MSILNQLNEDMKTAMRAKERDKLTTIRMIKASIQNEEIKKGAELNDEEILAILSREKKQRLESFTEFEKAKSPGTISPPLVFFPQFSFTPFP